MFQDKETGEFIAGVEDAIAAQTSDKVFVAKGGTNIEAALKDISKVCRATHHAHLEYIYIHTNHTTASAGSSPESINSHCVVPHGW
jgi:hypothetical protein